jgi:hypothetical protein
MVKQTFYFVARWLRAIWLKVFARATGRAFPFSNYRIDSRRPSRYIERRLRRKLRRNFRVALN